MLLRFVITMRLTYRCLDLQLAFRVDAKDAVTHSERLHLGSPTLTSADMVQKVLATGCLTLLQVSCLT